jgi:hypothetical protein
VLAFTSGGIAPAPPSGTPTPTPTSTATVTGGTPTPVGTFGAPGPSPSGDLARGAPAVIGAAAAVTTDQTFADPSFAALWRRVDEPVRQHKAERSWFWGSGPGATRFEPYKGATSAGGGDTRLVQYFDKARMEINQPGGDRGSAWFVTNGLLVREMVSAQVSLGDREVDQRKPAQIALAGDGDASTPTYANLFSIASFNGARRVPRRTDCATSRCQVVETLARHGPQQGKIGERPDLAAQQVVNVSYVPETGHNIPNVFWDFLTKRGMVETPSGLEEALLADWVFAFGYPLTEAYWTQATVGGVRREVLVQAFERRILTYTPGNAPAWQVEMGNVGQHYHLWRYSR